MQLTMRITDDKFSIESLIKLYRKAYYDADGFICSIRPQNINAVVAHGREHMCFVLK